MRFQPKRPRCDKWVKSELRPPSSLIAMAMQLAMMPSAKRDRELVANFATKGALLREAKMMSI
jgi:hypothetical protein